MTRVTGMLIVLVPAFVAACLLVVVYGGNDVGRQAIAVQIATFALIAVAIGAWQGGELIYYHAMQATKLLAQFPDRLGQRTRMALAACIGWALCVLMFVWAFQPFGRYISSYEWETIIKIIVAPPIMALIGYGLYCWARR